MMVRTFMALPLSDAVKARLVAAQEDLAAATELRVRWVARENLHLTIKFLGGIEDRALNDVCTVAAEAAGQVEPFSLAVTGLEAVPPSGRMRMVWAGIDEPTGRLAQLHALLEESCAALGFKEENRAFRPHLTLGRVKGGRDVADLRAATAGLAGAGFGGCPVDELIVLSSDLGAKGPTYAVLSHARLGG